LHTHWHLSLLFYSNNNNNNNNNNNKSESEFFQSYLSAWSAKFDDVQDTLPTKQPFWDRPGVLEDKALEASLNSIHLRASFLAASTHRSGDWLFAMPITS